MNISSGFINNDATIKIQNSVEIGCEQKKTFIETLPLSFIARQS